MHILFFSILVQAALLAGCAHLAAQGAAAAGDGVEVAAMVAYRCDSGRAVRVRYPTSTLALVEYEGRTREMTQALSASGARYTDGELEWWTKGTGPGAWAMLLHHGSDGLPGDRIEQCAQAGPG